MDTIVNKKRVMPHRLFFGSSSRMTIHALTIDNHAISRPLSNGERYVGAFIVPPFQRGLVWTVEQKIKLIESIYKGIPVGEIIWNQTHRSGPFDLLLLDGQQRLNAMLEWIAGAFEVSGCRYPELSEIERRHFNRMRVEAIQTAIDDEETYREIYDRLVYGSTPHN